MAILLKGWILPIGGVASERVCAKTGIFANFQRELLKTTIILGVYMNFVTTFENKKYFEEGYF